MRSYQPLRHINGLKDGKAEGPAVATMMPNTPAQAFEDLSLMSASITDLAWTAGLMSVQKSHLADRERAMLVSHQAVEGRPDGKIGIYNGDNADILFEHDPLRMSNTVNEFAGNYTSINSHSIAVGVGKVIFGSAYARFIQTAGKLLLTFRKK